MNKYINSKEDLYDECENMEELYDKYYVLLLEENQQLKQEYNKALELLCNYNMPCDLDGFMDKNTDYCSVNCGVDEEVFKECWRRYIKQELNK